MANQTTLWPDYIATETFPSDCGITVDQEYCPLGGFSALLGAATWPFQGTWNFSAQEPLGWHESSLYNRYFEGAADEGFWASSFLTQTTQLSTNNFLNGIEQGLDQIPIANVKWSMSLPDGIQSLAPATEVLCYTTVYVGNISSGPYSYTTGDGFNSSDYGLSQLTFPLRNSQTWSSDAAPLFAVWNSTTEMAALWVEPEDLGDMTPSIGVVWAASVNGTLSTDSSEDQGSYFNYSATIVACSVYANWQPIDLYINPFTDFYVHSSIVDQPFNTLNKYSTQQIWQPIKINTSWANSALPPNETIGQLVTKFGPSTISYLNPFSTSLGFSTSMLITDVLSRIGMECDAIIATKEQLGKPGGPSSQRLYTINEQDLGPTYLDYAIEPNNFTKFSLALQRYGYSYSITGITRILAAVILSLHILTATIFMIIAIRLKWSCYGLRSPCEVVVLALNSSYSKSLENTSAGIARFDTYKHIIKVREISDDRLGIVVVGDGGEESGKFLMPIDGKKYK